MMWLQYGRWERLPELSIVMMTPYTERRGKKNQTSKIKDEKPHTKIGTQPDCRMLEMRFQAPKRIGVFSAVNHFVAWI